MYISRGAKLVNRLAVHFPSAEEASLARYSGQKLAEIIDNQATMQRVSFTGADGLTHAIDMPVSALKTMAHTLIELGKGNAVTVTPIHAELTVQEAADLLDISKSTLVKMLDDGVLPFTKTGNRFVVCFADVEDYKNQHKTDRLRVLAELSRLDQEIDNGYE